MRTDIQALRAIAVLLVLVYHLVPTRLTGGFVGVDVFFVISGFLITSHLLQHPPRSAGDVADFWSRRIRRLLPASLLVLAVTLVASRLVAPETQWLNTAKQAAFAALYVVNWSLASDSVDYLAAENAASPVQHFWSLSVEEQFYFVWPIVIGLLFVWGLRRGRPGPVVILGLSLIATVSLVYSIAATAIAPASAYFVTPTRAWEFALGGILAAALGGLRPGGGRDQIAVPWSPGARVVLAVAGLAAIALTAVTFDGTTPFPSWRALLPTVGTVAVIAAMPTAALGPVGAALALRPVQWIGGVSYAVYLWHWPIIVLLQNVSGGLGVLDAAAVLVTTFVLAAVTKRFVEDPVRAIRPPRRAVFLATAAGMALVVLMAGLQALEVSRREAVSQRALAEAVSSGDPCLGAGSLYRAKQCRDKAYDTIVPAPAQAVRDKSAAYADVGGKDCWSYVPDFEVVTCTFGNPNGTRRLALVGNSHAGQWLPTLQAIAEAEDWQITTYLASRCAMMPEPQNFDTPAGSEACQRWVSQVTDQVSEAEYDLVVLTNRMSVTALGSRSQEQSVATYEAGYEQLLDEWRSDGVRVLGVHDTPAPGDGDLHSVPDCVAANAGQLDRCSGDPESWIPDEPLMDAARAVDSSRIRTVDLNSYICRPETCAPVVGGVLVYFDGSHLTATYARTLAEPLRVAMQRAAGGG